MRARSLAVFMVALLSETATSQTTTSTIIFISDASCQLRVDGDYQGELNPGDTKKIQVAYGDHIAQCKSGEVQKEQVFPVEAGMQKVVRFTFAATLPPSTSATRPDASSPSAPPQPYTAAAASGAALEGRYDTRAAKRTENKKSTKGKPYFTDSTHQLNIVRRVGTLFEGWAVFTQRDEFYDRSLTWGASNTPISLASSYWRVRMKPTTEQSGGLIYLKVHQVRDDTTRSFDPVNRIYTYSIGAAGELRLIDSSNPSSETVVEPRGTSPANPPRGVGLDDFASPAAASGAVAGDGRPYAVGSSAVRSATSRSVEGVVRQVSIGENRLTLETDSRQLVTITGTSSTPVHYRGETTYKISNIEVGDRIRVETESTSSSGTVRARSIEVVTSVQDTGPADRRRPAKQASDRRATASVQHLGSKSYAFELGGLESKFSIKVPDAGPSDEYAVTVEYKIRYKCLPLKIAKGTSFKTLPGGTTHTRTITKKWTIKGNGTKTLTNSAYRAGCFNSTEFRYLPAEVLDVEIISITSERVE